MLQAKDADIVKPWDQKGWKMPGGAPYHPAGFMTFVGASAMIHGKTKGVYPAAKALLSAVYEGALVDFDTALKIEARWFVSILLNPSSSAMIRSLFLNKEALEKGANRPAVPDQTVKKLGIMGAGMMGAGIAYVAANAGIEVVLIDQKQDAADTGKGHAESLLDKGVKRGKVTAEKKAEVLGRITATTDYAALEGCDLIVEAVFEDMGIKAEVTKNVLKVVPADCIFATNTSTLPITELAKASDKPEQFIGIHFFSPVDKMALVEIIKGEQTGDRAVAKALDFVRQIRKTPIVVNDARFFYANRCIIPYINEGIRMVKEGVQPALIENAAKLVGMPLGPLQLTDETSLDLGAKIAKATKAAMGAGYDDTVDEVIFGMVDAGRLGRKSKAGFYAYDEAGKRQGLWDGLADRYPVTDTQPELVEVQHRLLFAQVLEAVRALEDGVLTDIREGDVGAILGWGFAPWSGGPFSWLDILGTPYAAERCDQLQAAYGERFACPALLREMADKGQGFYARFGTGSGRGGRAGRRNETGPGAARAVSVGARRPLSASGRARTAPRLADRASAVRLFLGVGAARLRRRAGGRRRSHVIATGLGHRSASEMCRSAGPRWMPRQAASDVIRTVTNGIAAGSSSRRPHKPRSRRRNTGSSFPSPPRSTKRGRSARDRSDRRAERALTGCSPSKVSAVPLGQGSHHLRALSVTTTESGKQAPSGACPARSGSMRTRKIDDASLADQLQ